MHNWVERRKISKEIYFLSKGCWREKTFFFCKVGLLFCDCLLPCMDYVFLFWIIENSRWEIISYLFTGICIWIVIYLGLVIIENKEKNNLRERFQQKIITKLMHEYLSPENNYRNVSVSEAKTQIEEDSKVVVQLLVDHILGDIVNICKLAILLAFMLFTNPILSCISILLLPFSFLLTKILVSKANDLGNQCRDLFAQTIHIVTESLFSWKEIKTNCLEKNK